MKRRGICVVASLAAKECLDCGVESFAEHHDVTSDIGGRVEFEVIYRDLMSEELVLNALREHGCSAGFSLRTGDLGMRRKGGAEEDKREDC